MGIKQDTLKQLRLAENARMGVYVSIQAMKEMDGCDQEIRDLRVLQARLDRIHAEATHNWEEARK